MPIDNGVKVQCLMGHQIISNNPRHLKDARQREARGITDDLLIETQDCPRCRAYAFKQLGLKL